MIEITIPAKTFLIGEYAVLDPSGLAVLANTAPPFILRAYPTQGNFSVAVAAWEASPFPAGSPAAKFLEQSPELMGEYRIEFQDPYSGRGGLGASTAQFLGVYVLEYWHRHHQFPDFSEASERFRLCTLYVACAWNGTGVPPSGADLLSQTLGQIAIIRRGATDESLECWPFPDMRFVCIPTGRKVLTHEHLWKLADLPYAAFCTEANVAVEALHRSDQEGFIQSVKRYGRLLQNSELVHPLTQIDLDRILQCDGVLAVKGCGALGADTLAIFLEARAEEAFCLWANALFPAGCITQAQLHEGIRFSSSSLDSEDQSSNIKK